MSATHRARDAATGLLAVGALLAVVVGVPVALSRLVGWPLPTTAPSAGAVRAALRYGHVAPDTLLKALALVVWTAWLLMTAAIGVELTALVRGTVARRLPSIAGLQHLGARLLTAMMLLSTLTTRPAAAVAADSPRAAVAMAVERVPRPAAGERADDAPAPDALVWVVRRHDSLWTIAERALGTGHRWREIRDLNVGRPQERGGRLHAGDTMIHPGWVLRLPPGARIGDPVGQVRVQRGDHLWGLAEAHLGDGSRWRELFARNRGAPQPDGQRLTRADLIRPGWILTLPEARPGDRRDGPGRRRSTPRRHAPSESTADRDGDHAAPDVPVPPLPLTPRTLPERTDGASRPPAGGPAAARPESEPAVVVASAHRPHRARSPLPIAGGALLATGLIAVLARRRRQWLRRRRAGDALEPVDPEAAEVERWLRAMADHDLTHRTDRVLRLLAEHFAEHDVRPAVLALEVGERIRLVLSDPSPAPPPPGITSDDDGRTWLVDAELEVAAPRDENGPPLITALVGCGTRAPGEIVALNLFEARVVDVEGPRAQVREALTSWTAELASRGAATGVELVVVGPHHHLVEQFARVVIADDAAAAMARVDHMLDAPDPTGATPQVVVLCAAPEAGRAWDALRRRARRDRRIALVAARDDDRPAGDRAAHRVRLDGDGVLLDPPGMRLAAPEWSTPETWDHLGDLLRQPIRQRESDLVPAPLLTAPLDQRLAEAAAADDGATDPPDRTILVLGALGVDGAVLPRPPAGDVLAYLTVHPDGVPIDILSARITPRPGDDAALRAAIAELQAGAGTAPPWIRVDDGRCRLADGVGSDLQRFRLLTRRLDRLPPAEQAAAMQGALTLVSGPPFCDSGGWAHAEGLPTTVAALVSDIAHRLAALVLTFGDIERATWAVGQGLLANPGCELLHRDRMRIADACGDRAALDAIIEEVRVHAAGDDGWVTPETLQLYERLTRASTITAAPGGDAREGRRDAS